MDVDGSPEQLAALSSSSAAEDPEVTAQAPPTENQKKEKEEEVEVDAGAEEEEQEKATRKSRGAKSNRRKRRRGKGTAESVEQAEEEIRIHEWNLDAWQTLFSHGLNLGVPRGRVFLDRTVEKFPLAARFWKAYVELEMSAQNYDVVEALFEKCLKKCPDVELWSSYLRYVRIVKDGEEDANIVMSMYFIPPFHIFSEFLPERCKSILF